jgi:hypothetical protein
MIYVICFVGGMLYCEFTVPPLFPITRSPYQEFI